MFQTLKKATLAIAASAMVLVSPAALAAPVGSIEGNFYQVRNVTKNGAYGESATADKCETVKYSIQIHNPGPDPLTNVKVKATLDTAPATNHGSEATVSADNANPASRSDTTSVVLPAAYAMSYDAGSTRLLDPNGGVLQNLPDGIVGSGVTLPNGVGVSLGQIRFVQFQAKVACPEPPVCPPGTTGTPPNCVEPPKPVVVCDALSAEYIGSTNVPAKIKFTAKGTASGGATITGYVFDFGDGPKADGASATAEHTYAKEGDYKATVQVKSSLGTTAVSANCSVTIKVTKEKPPVIVPPVVTPPAATPAALPSTGPVELAGGLLGTSSLGFGIRQWLTSRRRLADTL